MQKQTENPDQNSGKNKNQEQPLLKESPSLTMPKLVLIASFIVVFCAVLGAVGWVAMKSKSGQVFYQPAPKTTEVKSENKKEEKIKIVTTISPLYSLVSNITGNNAEIENLVPHGNNVRNFQPKQEDIEKINKADILVANGLGYEVFLEDMLKKINNKNLKIIEVGNELDKLADTVLRPERESKNFVIQGNRYINNNLSVSFADIGRFPAYYKYIPNKPETHGFIESEHTFWYRGLFINVISKDELKNEGYHFFPPGYAHVKYIVFNCNSSFAPGALTKKCETNKKDFLSRYEFANITEFYYMGDEDSPTFPKTWQKLYVKLIGDKYVIAYGDLLSAKISLDELIAQNNLKIKDWDKIIDSIEVIDGKKDQNTDNNLEIDNVNPYIWLSIKNAPYIIQPVLDAVIKLECEKKGGKADLLTVNREIGRGATITDNICNFTSKKFIKNISEVMDRSIVQGEGYDNYFPKIWNEDNRRGDFYYNTESQFHKNYANYTSKLRLLDEEIVETISKTKGKNLIASSNVFQYFLTGYDFINYNRGFISDLENNQKLNVEELEQLVNFVNNNKIKILLTEKDYADNAVIGALKDKTKIEIIEIDPLDFELKPEGYENFLKEMSGIISG